MSNNNKNKLGYKQTPLGWVPEEWGIELLDSLVKRGSGHTPDKAFNIYYNGGIKWISLADSFRLDNRLISETEIEISIEGIKKSSAVLHPKGTVLMSRDAGIGKSAVMAIDMAVSQHFITWTCNGKLDNWFLYYWLQLKKEFFERQAVGSTIKTIGLPLFKKLKIISPPLSEQIKIATILATWDEAITKTQQLITQVQNRNKGLVQQLLTGKKRIKGFEKNKWNKLNANEIFKPVSIKNNGPEQLLSATQDRGIIPRHMLEGRVTMPSGATNSYKLVLPGNFIISLRSFQGGLEYSQYKGMVSPAYTVLKPIKPIADNFYKYYFKSYDFIGHLAVAVIGIRDGKQISFDDFCALRLPYPTIKEQIQIACIITKSEDEVSLYKQKLAILQQQKKGLMQKLLTGEIRVKIEN